MGSWMNAYAVSTYWFSREAAAMLLDMTTDQIVSSGIEGRPGAAGSQFSNRKTDRRPRRSRLDARSFTAHVLDRDAHGDQPGGSAAPATAFSFVLCAADRSSGGHAARQQAAHLASPGGTVEVVARPRPTCDGHPALPDAREPHDLLALPAGRAASAAVQHAPIPVLIARPCPLGTSVTDTILVPVDGTPESTRAVELAGRIAAIHGGTVSVLQVPAHDPALERAIAASSRTLLHTTGATPRLLGQPPPLEQALPSAAVALSASLVVLGRGGSELARRATARLAGLVSCSVLTVPVREQIPATTAQPLASS
jgi:nucleotide-binding universal stress UspA family protein